MLVFALKGISSVISDKSFNVLVSSEQRRWLILIFTFLRALPAIIFPYLV